MPQDTSILLIKTTLSTRYEACEEKKLLGYYIIRILDDDDDDDADDDFDDDNDKYNLSRKVAINTGLLLESA